jgi:hypothetical protein
MAPADSSNAATMTPAMRTQRGVNAVQSARRSGATRALKRANLLSSSSASATEGRSSANVFHALQPVRILLKCPDDTTDVRLSIIG